MLRRCATQQLVVILLAGSLGLLVAGCLGDAPHGNPLDPASDAFESVGAVEGRVTTFYLPFSGLAGAEVRLVPGPYVAITDAAGAFAVRDVPTGTYEVRVTKPGYAAAVAAVTVGLGGTTAVTVPLPGAPFVADASMRTSVVHRWWPQEPLEILSLDVQSGDPDGAGDVVRVLLEMPGIGFVDTLDARAEVGHFGNQWIGEALPAPMASLEGQAMRLLIEDQSGVRVNTLAPPIVRVVERVPLAVSPAALEVVEALPYTFAWETAVVPFAYTFQFDLVRVDENIQTAILTVADIDPDASQYVLASALEPGDYFWTISIVDAFGNRSRSKEAGFVVPAP